MICNSRTSHSLTERERILKGQNISQRKVGYAVDTENGFLLFKATENVTSDSWELSWPSTAETCVLIHICYELNAKTLRKSLAFWDSVIISSSAKEKVWIYI